MIKKTILSKISNGIFLYGIVFILFLAWSRYITRNLSTSLFISFIIATISVTLYILIEYKQLLKSSQKNNSQKTYNNFKEHFLYSSNKDIIDLLSKLYNLKIKDKISNTHIISTENKEIFFIFDTPIIDNEKIIQILKDRKTENIQIYCIENNFQNNFENINIEFVTLESIINKISTENFVVQNLTKLQNSKVTKDIIFKNIFNKTRSKNYFWLGILLIITSTFSPYIIYYNVVGTLLLIFSIYSKFNKKYN